MRDFFGGLLCAVMCAVTAWLVSFDVTRLWHGREVVLLCLGWAVVVFIEAERGT